VFALFDFPKRNCAASLQSLLTDFCSRLETHISDVSGATHPPPQMR